MKRKQFRLGILMALLTLVFMGEVEGQNQISGQVLHHGDNQMPMPGVDVILKDLSGNVVQSTLADEGGFFVFNNLEAIDYIVTAYTDQEPGDVVNMLDVSLLVDYLNGNAEFDSMQELAADVDGNGEVNQADLDFLMEDWYLYGEEFPVGDWVFEEVLVHAGGKDGVNVTGEVTSQIAKEEDPTKEITSLEVCQKNLLQNSIYEIPIYISSPNSIKSLYLEFSFLNEKFEILDMNSMYYELLVLEKENLIKLIWAEKNGLTEEVFNGKELFILKVLNKNGCSLKSSDFQITTKTSFITEKNAINHDFDIFVPEVFLKRNLYINFVNYPNPISDNITFVYELYNSGIVDITIYNISGELVHTEHLGNHLLGSYSTHLENLNFSGGIYSAHLILNGASIASRKLIFID